MVHIRKRYLIFSYHYHVFINFINFDYLIKYIIIKNDTPCEEAVKHIYSDSENGLQLSKPKFILSIIGGTKNFRLSDRDRETEKAFKTGLMKAAKMSDTWIITGGINFGAMRLVGDAIHEELNSNNFIVLGIAERKSIFGKYPEFRKKSDGIPVEKNGQSLNENNTSFIIVDNDYGDEHEFRTNLEAYIQQTFKIPFFIFVVNGDVKTLVTIAESLDNNLPMVIVAVS